jgi:hypothetical protein
MTFIGHIPTYDQRQGGQHDIKQDRVHGQKKKKKKKMTRSHYKEKTY